MRLILATAVMGLAAMISVASAADGEKPYMTMMGGKYMIMGGSSAQGTELMMGANGARPTTCPAGGYYSTDPTHKVVMACDNDARYSLAEPKTGTMMANGKPYPAGSMMMSPE